MQSVHDLLARHGVRLVAVVVFAGTLALLNAGRGRPSFAVGDLILSAATTGLVIGLVAVARAELSARRGRAGVPDRTPG